MNDEDVFVRDGEEREDLTRVVLCTVVDGSGEMEWWHLLCYVNSVEGRSVVTRICGASQGRFATISQYISVL